MRIATLLLIFTVFVWPCRAQNVTTFTFGAGMGNAQLGGESTVYASGSAGFILRNGPVLFTADINVDMAPGEIKGPYYYDSSVDRCRNRNTGRFASDANCEALDIYAAASLDANVAIPGTTGFAGLGGRFGEATTPYVSAGLSISPLDQFSILFKVRAWADHLFAGAVFSLPF